jgi:ring-1,2-phenylacetyl-CoA epoxidase subunit PaaD
VTALPDVEAVRRAVVDVPDPELPPVTIGMLGIVHHLAVDDDGRVEVDLLPTYAGCPATAMIERDVVAAARGVAGVTDVRVRFRFDPPWTSARIDATGRERLRSFGIAPPTGRAADGLPPDTTDPGAPGAAGGAPGGRPVLPLVSWSPPHSEDVDRRACPYCGSADTVRDSRFGPTPCRDLRSCRSCLQPFEAFRS